MGYYAGLDVALKMTSICIVAANGQVLREGSALSEPEAVIAFLSGTGVAFEQVGLAAGALSEWLAVALQDAGFPVVRMAARPVRRPCQLGRSRQAGTTPAASPSQI